MMQKKEKKPRRLMEKNGGKRTLKTTSAEH